MNVGFQLAQKNGLYDSENQKLVRWFLAKL